MSRLLRKAAWCLPALLWIASCDPAGKPPLAIEAAGEVVGVVYLDTNGNGSADAGDQPIPGLTVTLAAAGNERVLAEASTDDNGQYQLSDVPVGSYRLDVAGGDTLTTVEGGTPVTVQAGVQTQVDLGTTFPFLTPRQVRDSPPGLRVFTSGIALNQRLAFGDGRVHLKADTVHLRLLNVKRDSLLIGDSIRVLGRTASDNGQPILDDVTPYVLVRGAAVTVPRELQTTQAAEARAGASDAALVRVRNAEISDTSTVDGDYYFRLDDGTGSLEVVLQSFLGVVTSSIRPDTIVRVSVATGLLVPKADSGGSTTWRLYPRAAADVSLEVKQADVRVTTRLVDDTVSYFEGDTAVFRVVADNAGPLTAKGVVVLDSLSAGLTRLTHQTTRGTFDPATREWTLGDLPAGGKDTLRLWARVDSGTVGATVRNRARRAPLVTEVDPTSTNDTSSVSMLIGQMQADLSVTNAIIDTTVTYFEGDTVGYRVVVRNGGTFVAHGVSVHDDLGSGLRRVSHQVTRGSLDTLSNDWAIDSLASGRADTLRIYALVDSGTVGETLRNRASIRPLAAESDPVATNDTASVALVVGQMRADLLVFKALLTPTATFYEGDSVGFRVVAANAGPVTAHAVAVFDSLGAGLAYSSHQATKGSFDAPTGTWTLDSLRAQLADTILLWARVDSGTVADTVRNRARGRMLVSEFDADSTNNLASVFFVVGQKQANLGVSGGLITPGVPVFEGDTAGFRVVVSNAGPFVARTISIRDSLGAGLQRVSHQTTSGTFDVATGIWTLDSLVVADTDTLQLFARVDSGRYADTLRNRAWSLGLVTELDPVATNDTASAFLVVDRMEADLRLTKVSPDTSANTGDTINYTVVVRNLGPDAATGVRVQENPDPDLTTLNAVASRGTFDGLAQIWDLGGLAAGAADTLTLTVRVDSTTVGEVRTNRASVLLSGAEADTLLSNNEDSVGLPISGTDLAISKRSVVASPSEGQDFKFRVTVRSAGTATADSFVVLDTLPTGLTYRSHSAHRGSYDPVTGVWKLAAALAVGDSTWLDITAEPDSGTIGTVLTNTARLTDVYPSDVNATNDVRSASITVGSADMYKVSKLSTAATPTEGDDFQYRVVIKNVGPSTLENVLVFDTIPTGLTYQSDSTSSGAYDSGTGLWTLAGGLAIGDSAWLHVTVQADPGTGGMAITNRAHGRAAQSDTVSANNSATVTVNVAAPSPEPSPEPAIYSALPAGTSGRRSSSRPSLPEPFVSVDGALRGGLVRERKKGR